MRGTPRSGSDEVLLRAWELAARHLGTQADRPVAERVGREELRATLTSELTQDGEDQLQVLEDLADGAEGGLVATTGPRYFGFVIGGALPVSVGADWLVSAWDQNSGLYELAESVGRRVRAEGACWLAGTRWLGEAAMRISVANQATESTDIERSVASILAALDREAEAGRERA